MAPPGISLKAIRQQNELLMQELEAREREVYDLIRIRAELIAHSEALQKDFQRLLNKVLETFHRESAGRQVWFGGFRGMGKDWAWRDV